MSNKTQIQCNNINSSKIKIIKLCWKEIIKNSNEMTTLRKEEIMINKRIQELRFKKEREAIEIVWLGKILIRINQLKESIKLMFQWIKET